MVWLFIDLIIDECERAFVWITSSFDDSLFLPRIMIRGQEWHHRCVRARVRILLSMTLCSQPRTMILLPGMVSSRLFGTAVDSDAEEDEEIRLGLLRMHRRFGGSRRRARKAQAPGKGTTDGLVDSTISCLLLFRV